MLLHHPGTDDVKAYQALEQAVADAHGVSIARVILRRNLQRGVVVIPGSSNPDHIAENLDIFDFELTEDEMEQMKSMNRDESMTGTKYRNYRHDQKMIAYYINLLKGEETHGRKIGFDNKMG